MYRLVPLCLKPDVPGNSVSQQRVFITDRFHKILIKRKEEAGEEVSQGRCASTVGLTSPPSK